VAIAYHVLRQRRIGVASAVIADPERSTTMADSGAVRSVQAADLRLPNAALDAIWTPMHLERLARTYWRFLERISLGLIRVSYTPDGRSIVLLFKPLRLLSFHVPEYEMSGERGRVRWRIRDGILVARAGRGEGYLQIDVRRDPPEARRDGDRPRRGGGRQLLPVDRVELRDVALPGDPVAHPRPRDPPLPAVARPARPRGVAGRRLPRPDGADERGRRAGSGHAAADGGGRSVAVNQ
jgi:hypothetical protein